MKQILFSALIGLAFSVWAQAPQPAAKEPPKPATQATKPAAQEMKPGAAPEAAKPAAAQEPMKEAAKAAPAKQAAAAKKPRRWNEDARHCLERGTTTEIIKCAEEYL
jgi:hypothetical protein